MNRRRRRRSAELDPVVLLLTVLTIAVLAFTAWTLCSRAQAATGHPCPPGRIAMLAPTGWGCGMSQMIGVTSR